MEAASAEASLAEAERHARRAVELYPTRSYHRYLLGRILDTSGQDGGAEFREALRLSALAARVPRLALDGVQSALATLKTGGTREQAVAIFREWRKRQEARRTLAA
jgi:Flp pilus assembly protein TadD